MATRFDPDRHHRRSIRLQGYDYGSPGAYFVTICTHLREQLFEEPLLRSVADAMWQRIPRHFPHVQLDAWVVMPNHIHGVLVLTSRGEASPETVSSTKQTASARTGPAEQPIGGDASPLLHPGSLGAIVGNFKSVTARRINHLRGTPGAPVWQRNYYEHIVRNEQVLQAIRQYIADNPARWMWDTHNPAATGPDPSAVDLWRLLK
jgi:putative transposase